MTGWRSGPREAVKRPDPLARDPHPLTVAHWQLVKGKADEKMRRLLAATSPTGTVVPVGTSPNAGHSSPFGVVLTFTA